MPGSTSSCVGIDELAPGVPLHEDEATFEGNAVAKARQAADATGLPALGDDSGLEVDALAGAPGVWSARYAGEPSDDARNNAKLLARAGRGASPEQRTARYRCVAAYVDPRIRPLADHLGRLPRRDPRAAARQRRLWLRPAVFSAALRRSMAEIELEREESAVAPGAAFRALADLLRAEGVGLAG